MMTPVGQQITLRVLRGGTTRQLVLTAAERPNNEPAGGGVSASLAKLIMERPPDWGLKLEQTTEANRQRFGLDPKLSGVLVAAVEVGCEADDLGIEAGDVVEEVQGVPVSTPSDVTRILAVAHEQRRAFAALLVDGKRGKRWVSLSVGDAGS